TATPAMRPHFPSVWLADAEPPVAQQWLIDGLLRHRDLALVYGESGTGKTFFCLDMVYHLAAGVPWRGKDTTPGGIVVYVAAEAGDSIKLRAKALRQQMTA